MSPARTSLARAPVRSERCVAPVMARAGEVPEGGGKNGKRVEEAPWHAAARHGCCLPSSPAPEWIVWVTMQPSRTSVFAALNRRRNEQVAVVRRGLGMSDANPVHVPSLKCTCAEERCSSSWGG